MCVRAQARAHAFAHVCARGGGGGVSVSTRVCSIFISECMYMCSKLICLCKRMNAYVCL